MKLAEMPAAPRRNVLLYGPPKVGKTNGACTAPGKVALLNCDLPNATWFARSRHPQVDEIVFEGYATIKEIGVAINQGSFPYDTVIVDPVNELYRLILEGVSKAAVSPPLPAYQATGVHVERFCRGLCRSPDVNAVFVLHELPVKDEATGNFERLPNTGTSNPALGQKLMGMVDVIGYCGVQVDEGEPRYMAQTLPGGGRRGGDRFNVLGAVREVDLTEWFDLMDRAAASVAAEANKQEAVT